MDAIEQGRNYPFAYIGLGRTWVQAGRKDLQRSILLEGCERFPYEELLIETIRCLDKDDDQKLLVQYLSKYLQYYPKGPNAAEVSEMIQEILPGSAFPFDTNYRDIVLPKRNDPESEIRGLPVGKKLTFLARWGFIKLGLLEIELGEGVWRNTPSWRIQYIIRTYPGLPFISVTDTLISHISKDIRHSLTLYLRYYENDFSMAEQYHFDYSTGYFTSCSVTKEGYWEYNIHPLPPNVFDALSQTWIAQQFVLERQSGMIHSGISKGYEFTEIEFMGEDKPLELVDQTWETVKIDGRLRYAGVVGMTGEYSGWFSADERGLPLMAKFKIFLGSVTVELISIEDL
ncbi:DUF3108 domain-containing protein [Calditrichota bacterium]